MFIMPGQVQSVVSAPRLTEPSRNSSSCAASHLKAGGGASEPAPATHVRIHSDSTAPMSAMSTPPKLRPPGSGGAGGKVMMTQTSVTPSSLPPPSCPSSRASAGGEHEYHHNGSPQVRGIAYGGRSSSDPGGTSSTRGGRNSIMEEFDAASAAGLQQPKMDEGKRESGQPGQDGGDPNGALPEIVDQAIANMIKDSQQQQQRADGGGGGRGQYGGAVSRRGGRIGSPPRFSRSNPSEQQQQQPRFGDSNSPASGPQQVSVCGTDVPSLESCASSCSQSSPPPRHSAAVQGANGGKQAFMTFSPDGRKSNLPTPSPGNQPLRRKEESSEVPASAGAAKDSGDEAAGGRKGGGGSKAVELTVDTCNVYCNEGEESVERPSKNDGLTCKERVQSPPPTNMVCFAEKAEDGKGENGGGRHVRYQSAADLKLNSPCVFSPFSNLNVMDSPSFNKSSTSLTPIAGKSCLRSPNPSRSSRARGTDAPHTPKNLFDTPRGAAALDTPTAMSFSWLQSPSEALIPGSAPICGNTPVSSFFREACSGLRELGGEDSNAAAGGSSSRIEYSQICISPLAPSRRQQTSSGSGFSYVRSPKSPGNRSNSKANTAAPPDSSLDVHTVERDVNQDEDLSILLQLANSTSQGNVFRSPLGQHNQYKHFSSKDAQKSSLQLPMITSSSAGDGSPKLSRKPMPGSMKDDRNHYPGYQAENKSKHSSSYSSIRPAKKGSSSGKHPNPKKAARAQAKKAKGKSDKGKSGLILQDPHQPSQYIHPSMNGQHGANAYSMPNISMPRKQQEGQNMMMGPPMPSHALPPPVMAPGGSISTVIGGGGGQNHDHPHNHHGSRPYSQLNASGPNKMGQQHQHMAYSPSNVPHNNTGYPGHMHPHAQSPYPPPVVKRQLPPVSSGGKTPKKAKTSSPSKRKSSGGKSPKAKMASPPVDSSARCAAERQAAANANTPNANAAALAAAILRGVTMRPSGKWQAQLYYAGKSRYIGVFDTREKAALAYEIAREKLKADPKETMSQTPEATEAKVNLARKAAFAGVNEPDPRPPKKK